MKEWIAAVFRCLSLLTLNYYQFKALGILSLLLAYIKKDRKITVNGILMIRNDGEDINNYTLKALLGMRTNKIVYIRQ